MQDLLYGIVKLFGMWLHKSDFIVAIVAQVSIVAHGPLVFPIGIKRSVLTCEILISLIITAWFVPQSSTEPVLAAEFHPLEKGNIITCGKGQISFWTLEGGSLAKKTGIFDVSLVLLTFSAPLFSVR